MNIVLAQFYTDNLSYAPYSREINEHYCGLQNYTYFVENNTHKINHLLENRSTTWYKPKLILDVFNTYNPDYVLFLDMDAVVNDFNDRIENYIDPDYDIIFTEDIGHHSVLNAGVFLIKNSEWSRNFLNMWWTSAEFIKYREIPELNFPEERTDEFGVFKTALWHDQSCLTAMYKNMEDVRNHLKIIPSNKLNHNRPFENNFIFHAYAYGEQPHRMLDKVRDDMLNQTHVVEDTPASEPVENNHQPVVSNTEDNLAVFLHCYAINDWKDRLVELLNRVKWSGLYENSKVLSLTFSTDGPASETQLHEVQQVLNDHPNWSLELYPNNHFEAPTLGRLDNFVRSTEENYKVLYIHTKGVFNKYKNFDTHEVYDLKVNAVNVWSDIMQTCVIDRWRECVEFLRDGDTAGATNNGGWWWGNFWWANSDYIKRIKPFGEFYNASRWSAEAWLHEAEPDQSTIRFKELYKFTYDPYYTIIPKYFYDGSDISDVELIVNRVEYGCFKEQRDEGRPVAPGEIVRHDVTETARKCFDNRSFEISDVLMDHDLGDICVGEEKTIRIYFSTSREPNTEYVISTIGWFGNQVKFDIERKFFV